MPVARDSGPPALVVSGLAKRHAGGRGVSDISFRVDRGSITGFIGVNGAGKSTTLNAIVGLLAPDAGSVELFGAPADFDARQRIGFLPEERGLAPRERITEVIAFYAQLKGLGRRQAKARAEQLLTRIGLAEHLRSRVGELSKGNAQRVQFLCAIAHEPELLILDEPFTGLDPLAQAEMQSLLLEYRAGGGAVLFSTHSMSVAERLCDRVVMLSQGRTVFEGAVEDAAAHAPHGAHVTLTDGGALQKVVAGLGGEAHAFPTKLGEAQRWRVLLPPNVPYVLLMRALAEHQLTVHGAEPIEPSLEGALWALSQQQAAA